MSDENGSLFASPGSMGSFPSNGIVEPEVPEPVDEDADDDEDLDADGD